MDEKALVGQLDDGYDSPLRLNSPYVWYLSDNDIDDLVVILCDVLIVV